MKKFLAILLALVMLLSCVACGAKESKSVAPDAGKETAAPTEENKTVENKSMTVWIEKIYSDDANQNLHDRVVQFGEENGINVTCEIVTGKDFLTKLNATIEAGRGVPDVVATNQARVINYYPNIPYMDVTDLVNEIDSERPILEASYQSCLIGDKMYTVPFGNSSELMFIRKDKMEEAGITEMPTTWEEVIEAARAITDPENDFYGLGMGCGSTDNDGDNLAREWMWMEGGSFFNEEGEIVLDDGVFAEIANIYADLYQNDVIPPDATTWDDGGNNANYLMGRLGIVVNAPTMYRAMTLDEKYANLLENTYVSVPPVGSNGQIFNNYARGFAIMNGCQVVDEAKALIKYLLEPEWYNEYSNTIAPVICPVFEDNKEDPVWRDDPVNAKVMEFVENTYGFYGYPVANPEIRSLVVRQQASKPLAQIMNQVATGTMSVEDAIKEQIFNLEDLIDQFG